MDKQLIKERLLEYNREFKRTIGNFKSFEVVFDYINFLVSEPYLIELLAPLIDYIEAESQKLENEDFKNIMIDFSVPDGLSAIPIFKDKFKIWQDDLNNKREPNIMASLPLNFILLVGVACLIEEIKEAQKTGDIVYTKKLVEEVKEKSLSVLDTSNIKGVEMKRMTYGQYIDISMELVNKSIIDEIDAEALLNSSKPKSPLSFDKEKSILNIRGQEIKIALKTEKPIDHYILECLFSKDDLSEPADFVEISKDFLKEDYNGNRQRFRHACDKLNRKISKATSNKINNFITYTTGSTGWCQINHKYL